MEVRVMNKLKWNGWQETLKFKPFEQSQDELESWFVDNPIRNITITLSFLFGVIGVVLTIYVPLTLYPDIAYAFCVGLRAILSGFEWHLGLKTMALNNLFFVIVAVMLLILAKNML